METTINKETIQKIKKVIKEESAKQIKRKWLRKTVNKHSKHEEWKKELEKDKLYGSAKLGKFYITALLRFYGELREKKNVHLIVNENKDLWSYEKAYKKVKEEYC